MVPVSFNWIDKPVAGEYSRLRVEWSLPSKRDIWIKYVSGKGLVCYRIVEARALDTGEVVRGGGECTRVGGGYLVLRNTSRGYMVASIRFPEPTEYVIEVAGERHRVLVEKPVAPTLLSVKQVLVGQVRDRIYVEVLLNRRPSSVERATMKLGIDVEMRGGGGESGSKTFYVSLPSTKRARIYIRPSDVLGREPSYGSKWSVRVCASVGASRACGSGTYWHTWRGGVSPGKLVYRFIDLVVDVPRRVPRGYIPMRLRIVSDKPISSREYNRLSTKARVAVYIDSSLYRVYRIDSIPRDTGEIELELRVPYTRLGVHRLRIWAGEHYRPLPAKPPREKHKIVEESVWSEEIEVEVVEEEKPPRREKPSRSPTPPTPAPPVEGKPPSWRPPLHKPPTGLEFPPPWWRKHPAQEFLERLTSLLVSLSPLYPPTFSIASAWWQHVI